jgi:ABC-type glutathione transport system ATPase component
MNATILEVRDLSIDFHSDGGLVRAVDEVGFAIQWGEILGLVGESGAGKTLTSEAILRLIRCPPGRISGAILYRGGISCRSASRSWRTSGAKRSP